MTNYVDDTASLDYVIERSKTLQKDKLEELNRESVEASLMRFELDSSHRGKALSSSGSRTLERLKMKLANKSNNLDGSSSLFPAKSKTSPVDFGIKQDESVATHGNISVPSSANLEDDEDVNLDIVKAKKKKKKKKNSAESKILFNEEDQYKESVNKEVQVYLAEILDQVLDKFEIESSSIGDSAPISDSAVDYNEDYFQSLRIDFMNAISQKDLPRIAKVFQDHKENFDKIFFIDLTIIFHLLKNSDKEFLKGFIDLLGSSLERIINNDHDQEIIKFMMHGLNNDQFREEKLEIFTKLIKKELINKKFAESNQSPLLRALQIHDIIFSKILISNDARLDDIDTHLFINWIITSKQITESTKLLMLENFTHISSPNSLKKTINLTDHYGFTALDYALGKPNFMKILIDQGAQLNFSKINLIINYIINYPDDDLKNKIESLEIVHEQYNKNNPSKPWSEVINLKNELGFTQLDLVFQNQVDEFAIALVKIGAKLSCTKNPFGSICRACDSNYFNDYIEFSRENDDHKIFTQRFAGCHNLIQHLSRSTLLNFEEKKQRLESIEKLGNNDEFIKAINIKNHQEQSAFDIAIITNQTELAIHLAQKGANLHLDNAENSVLFKFFKNNNIEMLIAFYEKDLIKFNEIPREVLEEFKQNLLVEKEQNPIVQIFLGYINEMQIKEKEIITNEKPSDDTLSVERKKASTHPTQQIATSLTNNNEDQKKVTSLK